MDAIQSFVVQEFTSLFESLGNSLSNPAMMFTHLTYVMLFASVMMRDIAWLRTIAVVAGGTKIYFQQFYSPDPIDLFWESLLIAVNLLQLAIIWLDNRRRNFSAREKAFLATFEPALPNAEANALLKSGEWGVVEAGSTLTRQGESVGGLIYIASGNVRIEANGHQVATCGPGDFLGEMTWQTGQPATGTAVAETQVEILGFQRGTLKNLLEKRQVLGFAFQSSFNRNLIAKLSRANEIVAASAFRS